MRKLLRFSAISLQREQLPRAWITKSVQKRMESILQQQNLQDLTSPPYMMHMQMRPRRPNPINGYCAPAAPPL